MTVPADLRNRVLAASRLARRAGRSTAAVPDIAPAEAFARAADSFHALLCVLDDEDWRVPVLRDLDVQALVGHLIGVEEDVQRSLAGDASVADADHIASTQPAADRQAGAAPARTRADWRRAADATLVLVEGDGDHRRQVSMHGMRLPVDDLLVVRAFELWTHENDIRCATGRPASAPDAATLQLMTSLAVRMLPHGVTKAGVADRGVDLHLVLTGAGGGTWDVALGAESGRERVLIVADAVDFCRLVADRVAPADLDVHVTGDGARADAVLRAAAALALD